MEDPEVFAESHRLVFESAGPRRRGRAADRSHRRAVRPDGVSAATCSGATCWRWARPSTSARRDGLAVAATAPATRRPGPPPPWNDIEPAFLPQVTGTDLHRPRHGCRSTCVVEKILAADETLPDQWLVAGTTGYDFLNSRERAVRRSGRAGRTDEDLRPLHRPAARLPRSGLPIEAADPPHGHGERSATAGPPAQSHFRAAPALARLHAQHAAGRAAGDPRLLSRLPHLYPRRLRLRARPAGRLPRGGAGEAPQPGHRRRRVRLHSRRAAAGSAAGAGRSRPPRAGAVRRPRSSRSPAR